MPNGDGPNEMAPNETVPEELPPLEGAPSARLGTAPGLGVGVDTVHVPTFTAQLDREGTVFSRVFTDQEWAYCTGEAPQPHASLAARWAAKEAFIKAWSALLLGQAPPLEPQQVNWAEIEVRLDRYHRPYLHFRGAVAQTLQAWAQEQAAVLHWALSLSHDGPCALAFVQVMALPRK